VVFPVFRVFSGVSWCLRVLIDFVSLCFCSVWVGMLRFCGYLSGCVGLWVLWVWNLSFERFVCTCEFWV